MCFESLDSFKEELTNTKGLTFYVSYIGEANLQGTELAVIADFALKLQEICGPRYEINLQNNPRVSSVLESLYGREEAEEQALQAFLDNAVCAIHSISKAAG